MDMSISYSIIYQCLKSAFSSFPDSLQFDQGSQVHSFRIRDVDPSQEAQSQSNDKRPASEDGFIYGYSYFTQRRDETSKRGYQQVTHMSCSTTCVAECNCWDFSAPLSFWHTFNILLYSLAWQLCLVKSTRRTMCRLWKLLSTISQTGMITTVHSHMCCLLIMDRAKWRSDPTPGTTVELGFLGSVMHVELPLTIDEQQLAETASFDETFDPTLHVGLSECS